MPVITEAAMFKLGTKPSAGDWDGTGKHPILQMTREEIIAYNKGVTERHTGSHADSNEKTAQPEYDKAVQQALEAAEGNARHFMNAFANSGKSDNL